MRLVYVLNTATLPASKNNWYTLQSNITNVNGKDIKAE